MSNYLNVNIPVFFAFLDTGFLYDEDPSSTNKRIVVEVFNFTSIPQRCESTGSRWVSESEEELWFYEFKERG